MIFDPLEYCEFCKHLDGAHGSTCALNLLARDIEVHAGAAVEFYPNAARGLTASGPLADAGPFSDLWPDSFSETL